MKNRYFLFIALCALALNNFICPPCAQSEGDSTVNSRPKQEYLPEDGLLKIERSEIILQGPRMEDAHIEGKTIHFVARKDKGKTAPQRQPAISTGVSIARASSVKDDLSKGKDKMRLSIHWRKRTLNLPTAAVSPVKTKDSKELTKLERQRKERKGSFKKALESLPSRPLIQGNGDGINDGKLNGNSIKDEK